MTSPDFRPYVDLTIYDQEPADIYLDAIDYGVIALPEFESRPGTVEDAVLQAMSYISGRVVSAINRLPDGIMEGVLRLLGLNRVEAQFATSTAFFTAIDTNGLTIPAGTKIGYTEVVEGGVVQHVFSTLSTASVEEGSNQSNAVTIQADRPGVKPPLLGGQQMVILTSSNRLFQAFLASTIEQGSGGETDVQYFSRGVSYLASLSSGLVTNNQIQNFVITNFLDAVRARSYDLTTIASIEPTALERLDSVVTATVESGHGVEENDVIRVYGAGPSGFNGVFTAASVGATEVEWLQAGSNASATAEGFIQNLEDVSLSAANALGYVTIFVSGPEGASLTPEKKEEIRSAVEARMVAGIEVSVVDALVVPVTIDVNFTIRAGFDSLVVSNAIEAFLEDLVSPDGWDWSPIIRVNALIARVAQISGVDYVDTLTLTLEPGEVLAEVNGTTGDVEFFYKGILPSSTITTTVV